jgi:DNA polymerase-3 subunit gamma/tau
MTHQVLARKWRPRTFADVVGQQHIVRALSNALQQQRLHHAYLLTGTRGVGKTTLARILAKCLNCEQGMTATPCLQCGACEAIEQGRFVDLIEIDAASRTRVEDTRELLDNVQYMPTLGRYKIYLIDEVHMLSNHSFNALLKTLEEPPAHVIFILATTNPEKLPVTILSRCLQFQLKSMTADQIAARLTTILQTEAIAFEANALPLIAKAADGSMRDALSLLDQVIAFSQDTITDTDVVALIGGVSETILSNLLYAIAQNDGITLINTIQQLQFDGVDFEQALEGLLELLHCITLQQLIPSADQNAQIAQLAASFSKEQVQLYYQIGLMGKRDLSLAPSPRLGFEMTLLRMLAFAPATIISDPAPHNAQPAPTPVAPVIVAPQPKSFKEVQPDTPSAAPEAKPAQSAGTMLPWPELILQLRLTGAAKALANYSMLISFDDNKLVLQVDGSQSGILNSISQQKLADALVHYFNKSVDVTIELGPVGIACPANLLKQADAELRRAAEQALTADPGLTALTQRFNAAIDPTSIKPVMKEENNI